jgi:epoxide hydrolase 4
LLEFLTGGFGGGRWLTDARRAAYLDAWRQPGALEAMVAWYKATPLVVPKLSREKPEPVITVDPLAHIPLSSVRVRMPHLVLWGRDDKALRPSCLLGLDDFCDALTVRQIEAADHWIVHQQPDAVVGHIRAFLNAGI